MQGPSCSITVAAGKKVAIGCISFCPASHSIFDIMERMSRYTPYIHKAIRSNAIITGPIARSLDISPQAHDVA